MAREPKLTTRILSDLFVEDILYFIRELRREGKVELAALYKPLVLSD